MCIEAVNFAFCAYLFHALCYLLCSSDCAQLAAKILRMWRNKNCSTLCPVLALLAWLQVTQIKSGPLFPAVVVEGDTERIIHGRQISVRTFETEQREVCAPLSCDDFSTLNT